MSRVGRTTKIHAIVDGLGNPVEFLLSRGNEHDSTHAIELLSKINISESKIFADKAYGSKSICEYITEQNAAYTIPPRSCDSEQWYCDWWVYKERHLVECFFQTRPNQSMYRQIYFVPGIRLKIYLAIWKMGFYI